MILTEKDASEKRCTPFAVVRLMEQDERKSLEATGALSFNCIGSACMQWRWRGRTYEEKQGGIMPHGYCGMAERPESDYGIGIPKKAGAS